MTDPQWIATVISLVALVLALKRDTRNAKHEDLQELRRERDECKVRLAEIEEQVEVLREENLILMKKVLGLEGTRGG
jgi:hypothetical protein